MTSPRPRQSCSGGQSHRPRSQAGRKKPPTTAALRSRDEADQATRAHAADTSASGKYLRPLVLVVETIPLAARCTRSTSRILVAASSLLRTERTVYVSPPKRCPISS